MSSTKVYGPNGGANPNMQEPYRIMKPGYLEERAFIMELGERIRKLRKELNMSQAQLAKKIGMHPRQLPRYEISAGKPSIDTLKKLAKYLEVSTDYLLYGEDEDLKKKTKVNDPELLHLFQRADSLKKPAREQIKWGIESLLCNLPEEESGIKPVSTASFQKIAKSA